MEISDLDVILSLFCPRTHTRKGAPWKSGKDAPCLAKRR